MATHFGQSLPIVNGGRARYVGRIVSESTDLSDSRAAWSWRLILEFHGQRRVDRALPADATVTLGESPASSLVVPGVGGRVPVVQNGQLVVPAGCAGEILDAEDGARDAGVGSPTTLQLGERARLTIVEHPGVVVELRRETATRARFGSRIAWGELGRTLVYGAAAIALLGIGVAVREPVAEVLAYGDPDADDSPIARAMFETTALEPAHRIEWGAAASFVPTESALLELEPELEPEPEPEPEDQLDPLVSPAPESEVPPPPPPKKPVEPEELVDLVVVDEPEPKGVIKQLGRVSDGEQLIGVLGALDGGAALVDIIAEDSALDEVLTEVAVEPTVASHTTRGQAHPVGVVIGTAGAEPEFTCENPEQRAKPNVDVVFVIDVSTTMGFMLDRVEQGIAEVDAELRKFSRDPRYGLVVFVDDVLVSNNGQPFPDLETLRAEFTRWRGFTTNNHQVLATETPNLDWPENSLDALHAAATQFAWRPADDTVRLVIHATDDDFREAPAVQSEQRVEHTYLETLEALRDHEVRVASFAARIGGECECLDVEPGWFKPFGELPSMPDGTGGAVFDIDEVAAGRVGFAAAIQGTVRDSVCTRYPLFDFVLGKTE